MGASLLLAGLLVAAPQEMPGMALGLVVGGLWLSLVLIMTLPSESERAGRELIRRLAQFRHEIHGAGDAPTRSTLERLLARPRELGLHEEEVFDELGQIHACIDALDVRGRVAHGELPRVEAPDPLPAGHVCHFVTPARFGRRRADQLGHLVLASGWLQFRGAVDVCVAWRDIASVRRHGREIVVALHSTDRLLRFACQSYSDAAVGGVLAEALRERESGAADQTSGIGHQASGIRF